MMAGQWVAPDGGLSGCLMSARATVRALCRLDRQPFLAHGPVTLADDHSAGFGAHVGPGAAGC